jgi:rhodanese-related sulfurtransferase
VAINEIDVDELEKRRAEGAPVIDVRQPDEYEEAHVPGAILIPLAEVPDRLAEIPSDGTALLICRSGARSMKAAEFLGGQGVVATNVAGGTLAWIDAGKPTVTGPNAD